ncbi:MAG: protein kinase [Myxococcaceae bacterium]|nr:protein kinase [Myxococcaceae bacterium]
MTVQGSPGQGEREPVGAIAARAFGQNYVLVRKLAEGGMAEIFLAKQVGVQGFERDVVIKRMLQNLSGVTDFVNMFLDEARLASRLAHPNIVQINDLGLTDGCYYIAMEYLPGEDFSTLLRTAARRREYVPLAISLRVLAEAARGLHFAHSFTDAQGQRLNIVHRDVSPSNIFVTYTGQVKVLDFGIARAESRITQTTAGVVKGKYQYMSPEQARSDVVDCRSDIYSLGVSTYEAVTNTRPFARESDLAILNAVLKNEFRPVRELRPDLPEDVERIIVKALSPDPNDRFQTAEEFAEELERFLAVTTSGGGTSSLATFMAGFFGPERMSSKVSIDSLAQMAKKGVDVPGYSNPYAPKTEAGASDATVATKVVSPGTVAGRPVRRRGALLLAGALGVLALGAAVAVGAVLFRPPAGGAVDPVVPVAADAGAMPEPVPDAAVAAVPVAVEDAGAVAPVVDAGVKAPAPSRPVVLDQKLIMGVVRRFSGKVAKCFEQFSGELPAAQGQLDVTFTIVSSGKTVNVSGGLPGKQVSRCVEGVVKEMQFPAHRDKEVTITVPFTYTRK